MKRFSETLLFPIAARLNCVPGCWLWLYYDFPQGKQYSPFCLLFFIFWTTRTFFSTAVVELYMRGYCFIFWRLCRFSVTAVVELYMRGEMRRRGNVKAGRKEKNIYFISSPPPLLCIPSPSHLTMHVQFHHRSTTDSKQHPKLPLLLDCLHRVISIQLFLPASYDIVPGLPISC